MFWIFFDKQEKTFITVELNSEIPGCSVLKFIPDTSETFFLESCLTWDFLLTPAAFSEVLLQMWTLYFHHFSHIEKIHTPEFHCFPNISSEIRIVAMLILVQYILSFNRAKNTNLYNKVDLGFFKACFFYKYKNMLHRPQPLLRCVSTS